MAVMMRNNSKLKGKWLQICKTHKSVINKCSFFFFKSININSSSISKTFIIAMGDCIPVRPWHDSPIECLAEVRMIWRDKTEQTLLLSLRLYILPENTPKGRVGHGEVSPEFNNLENIFFLTFFW